MEYNTPRIDVELREIGKYVYTNLDYDILDYEGRKIVIDGIMNVYGEQINAHMIYLLDSNLNDYKNAVAMDYLNNVMDSMTEYLLNSKDVHKDNEYTYSNPSKLKDGAMKNAISLESYVSDIMSDNANTFKHYDDSNIATYRIEELKEEMDKCDFIIDYKDFNEKVRSVIETGYCGNRKYTDKEIAILKKGIGYCKHNSIEIDKDMIALFKEYKGYIYFKQPLKESTVPSFEDFEFDNPKHIMALLKFRGSNNFNNDIGCLVYDLNKIISRLKLNESELAILDMYRNHDMTTQAIADDIGVSKQYISAKIANICKKISKQYWKDYEDWYYTFIAKGTYKKCKCCGRVKLANERYFSKSAVNKDKLQNICKICDVMRKRDCHTKKH